MRPRRRKSSLSTRVFAILALLVILSMILGTIAPAFVGFGP